MTVRVAVEGSVPIEPGRCHVIAEAGANHNNSVDTAVEMAEAAAGAGAWAIKYQLYKADELTVPESPKYWRDDIGTTSQYEAFLLSDHLPYGAYAEVAAECRRLGIVFFATPFDPRAVEALEAMEAPIYKIASGDITHRPLLEEIRATGKPVLLSTGASTVEEIERAVGWLGNDPERIVLLVCTLTYPTPDEDGNFARIERFREDFDPFLVGMSDHTLGVAGGWMTAALGGVCIEKHYTLDKSMPDVPDHAMSVDPVELADLVAACQRGAALRGTTDIGVRASEHPARTNARRSVVTTRAVEAGEPFEAGALGFKRPGTGLAPYELERIVSHVAARGLPPHHTITEGDLA